MTCEFSIEKVQGAKPQAFWDQLARLHQEEIDGGFLSSLGVRTLALLYAALARSPYTTLIVAIAGPDEGVVAFICGSADTRQVYKYVLLRHGLRFLPALVPRMFSFCTLKRIVETLLYPVKGDVAVNLPRAEILNFCVSRTMQRKGLGRGLFDSLMDEFRARRLAARKIVTGATQHKAQRFYESVNAVRVGAIEVHKGAESVLFRYDIPALCVPADADQSRRN
jgi:ribosomal protein S18 acetylase RimI-like enzyme